LITVVILAITASLGGYVASREYTAQRSDAFGASSDTPDRVTMTAWITRVDTVAQTVAVTFVDVTPRGSLAGPDGTFAKNAVFDTNAVQTGPVNVAAGEELSGVEQHFSLDGAVTDFPFDRYTAYLSLNIEDADGNNVPITVNVESTDAFFKVSPSYDEEQDDYLNVDLKVERSPPTMVFGIFIMVLMLGLAFAAAVLAYFLIRNRQGLQYSAYSVMGALLFAMVPLRNAVPGSPPIGSVIDFMAFFIAEAVISASLITSVVVGYRQQLELDRARDV
jgi:hypothetical protein